MSRPCLEYFAALIVIGTACGGGGNGGNGNNNVNIPGPDTVDLKQGEDHDFIINSVEFTITMTSAANGTIRAENLNQVDDMLVQVTDRDTGVLILPDPLVTIDDFILLAPNQSMESSTVTLGNGRRLHFAAENIGTTTSPPACSRTTTPPATSCIEIKNLTIN